MKIAYSIGVHVPAGWRQVRIVAEASRVSPGFARVTDVLEIDGEHPSRHQSRTGARRQEFNGQWWAANEVGKRKRLSACRIMMESQP